MKKALKIPLIVFLTLICLVALGLLLLSVTEYRPADSENVEINGTGSLTVSAGNALDIVTWNIGYAGLGAGSDFFMDGGTSVRSADKATVQDYLSGIQAYLNSDTPDVIMLQEVDINSTRTYGINETEALSSGCTAFAYNFHAFVPYPLPMIGSVRSGLFTVSQADIESAERLSLPCPFSWPVRTANLKRCLLVSYIPLENSEHYLVIVNLHLEAYDTGEGKIAQTNQLREFIQSEYEKGNYVIAGGDFNQVFPGSLDIYPNTHPDLWEPGILENSLLPDGWSFAYDLSSPTCRLLNQPLDSSDTENTQYYVIDGFIISPNVKLLDVQTVDLGFAYSDHNPVRLHAVLSDSEN